MRYAWIVISPFRNIQNSSLALKRKNHQSGNDKLKRNRYGRDWITNEEFENGGLDFSTLAISVKQALVPEFKTL